MSTVGSVIKTTLKNTKPMDLVGDAFNIVGGISDYKDARQQENSKAVSVAKAIGTFAFSEMLGWGAIPYMAAQMTGTLGGAVFRHTSSTMRQAYDSRGRFGSGYFEMSNAGYTMRQRSLNAIRNNGLNTRSVLGNEARTYYRGSV